MPETTDKARASMLRGFGQQIAIAGYPSIDYVKQCGKDVGLVIMTQEEYDNVYLKSRTDKAIFLNEVIDLIQDDTIKTASELIRRIQDLT